MYAVANLGAFAVAALVSRTHPGNRLTDYRGLYATRPLAALALGFFLLCLAGLPPGIIGLFAKVTVFSAAVDAGLGWLAVVMAVNVVIALYYGLQWAASLFRTPEGAPETAAPDTGEEPRPARADSAPPPPSPPRSSSPPPPESCSPEPRRRSRASPPSACSDPSRPRKIGLPAAPATGHGLGCIRHVFDVDTSGSGGERAVLNGFKDFILRGNVISWRSASPLGARLRRSVVAGLQQRLASPR
ncbi:NAD(P)H-quinone oxidoreductase subunit 2, chloroplastic [Streptomyces californicus]